MHFLWPRSTYVCGVAYVCCVAYVCVCRYRYLKCDSCQYFAGMLIHFRFGENLALCILFGPIFRQSHAKFFLGSKILFCSTPQETMVLTITEGIVNRFLGSAKAEMLQKNETEIRCLC